MDPKTMNRQKLRILALHGYHGSGGTLRQQAAAWVPVLEEWAEVHYVDAPSLAEGDFGWWHASSDDDGRPRMDGSSRLLAWLRDLIAREGPFDGVLGFSQGGAMAAVVAGGAALAFAIVVGGFATSDPEHEPLLEALGRSDLRSLHVVGRADGVVPPSRSRALASRFRDPTIVEHDGGHVIPGATEVRTAVAGFLADQVLRVRSKRSSGEGPLEVPLWPDRVRPAMRVFRPYPSGHGARPAMVVFRGGGYGSSTGSGAGAAEWAARHGMVGVEVDYGTRSTGAFFPTNFVDAARAVRLVRAHAVEWGIAVDQVAVMGFSAGGHLASLLSTRPSLVVAPEDDLATTFSARPDRLVLAYPLISFTDGYRPGAFVGSVDNFFGHPVDEAERVRFSNERHVEAGHPPVFVWTTRDDALVPFTHAVGFAEACQRADVPVQLLVYPTGPHGMGLALDRPDPVRGWTDRLLEWMSPASG